MEQTAPGVQAAPTTDRERIFALDALRGIAVLGILLMNITGFGLPSAYTEPSVYGGATGADLWAWIVTSFFFEGTMRGLFTILFGAGVVLYTSRLERAGVGLYSADLFFRRNLWLILFGLVNAYVLLWDGDILFYYGVTGLFLYVFRNLPARKLLLFAIPLLCVQTVSGVISYNKFQDLQARAGHAQVLQAEGKSLTEDQQADLDDFKEQMKDAKPPKEKIDKTIGQMRGGWASAFEHVSSFAFYLESEFFYRLGFWECIGMMLLGMALLKSGALTATVVRRRPTGRCSSPAGAVGFTVNGIETAYQLRSQFELTAVMHPELHHLRPRPHPADARTPRFHHAAASRSGVVRGAFRVLAATGQMALTNYLAQSVICLFVFTGVGFAPVRAAGAPPALLRGARDLGSAARLEPVVAATLPLRPDGVAVALAHAMAEAGVPARNPASRRLMIASASAMMRSISSLQVGTSWISPATMPHDHAPASISPCCITFG